MVIEILLTIIRAQGHYACLFKEMCLVMAGPWAFLKTIRHISGPSHGTVTGRDWTVFPSFYPVRNIAISNHLDVG